MECKTQEMNQRRRRTLDRSAKVRQLKLRGCKSRANKCFQGQLPFKRKLNARSEAPKLTKAHQLLRSEVERKRAEAHRKKISKMKPGKSKKSKKSHKGKKNTTTEDLESPEDKSLRLCTKNVNGQMFLVMEPENENSVSSESSMGKNTSNILNSQSSQETDSADTFSDSDSTDSNISVVLLNESASNENIIDEDSFLNDDLYLPSTIPPASQIDFPGSASSDDHIQLRREKLFWDLDPTGGVLPAKSISSLNRCITNKSKIDLVPDVGPTALTESVTVTPLAVDSSGNHSVRCELPKSFETNLINTLGSSTSHTYSVNKMTNSVLPKNIIVKSSQPLSQEKLRTILSSFKNIMKVTSQDTSKSIVNSLPKLSQASLTKTSTIFSNLEPTMSSSVSNKSYSKLSPKPGTNMTNTSTKKVNQHQIVSLPSTSLPKRVFVVPLSLPSSSSHMVQLSMMSNSIAASGSSSLTTKCVSIAPSVTPIQKTLSNITKVANTIINLPNKGPIISLPTSATLLKKDSAKDVLNFSHVTNSQTSPCVILPTTVGKISSMTSDKAIVHKRPESSDINQGIQSSDSSPPGSSPSIKPKENSINSDLILQNCSSDASAVSTNVSTISPQQVIATSYVPGKAGNTSFLVLPSSTSDGSTSPVVTVKTEPKDNIISSASLSTITNMTASKSLSNSILGSDVKDSSLTNVPMIKYTTALKNTPKVLRPLAPKTESYMENPPISTHSMCQISPTSSSLPSNNDSSSCASASVSTKTSSPPLSNATTNVSYSSNFSKPMVFIGPISAEDIPNLAKHIPSAAPSAFQFPSTMSSESIKIIHPDDIYKCSPGISKTPSTMSSESVKILHPDDVYQCYPGISKPPTTTQNVTSDAQFPSTMPSESIKIVHPDDIYKCSPVVKGCSPLNTPPSTTNLQSVTNDLPTSKSNHNANLPAKTVHSNVPFTFYQTPKSSSSEIKVNFISQAGSNSIYSQSQLKLNSSVASTINNSPQAIATANNINPTIKIKQELPDCTTSSASKIVSVVSNKIPRSSNSTIKLCLDSNKQLNLAVDKSSHISRTTGNSPYLQVVNNATLSNSRTPQLINQLKTGVNQGVPVTTSGQTGFQSLDTQSTSTRQIKLAQIVCTDNKKHTIVLNKKDSDQLVYRLEREGNLLKIVGSPKPAAPCTSPNTSAIKYSSKPISNLIINSSSKIVVPDYLTKSKSSDSSQQNETSVKVSNCESSLGNIKSIIPKEEDNPLSLKIDSIFSLQDSSNLIDDTAGDWEIKPEKESTKDINPGISDNIQSVAHMPGSSNSTNSITVISTSTHSSSVLSSPLVSLLNKDIKPGLSSLTPSMPVISTTTNTTPVVSSVNSTVPMVSLLTEDVKPVISSLNTPKTVVNSTIKSKPAVSIVTTLKTMTTSNPIFHMSLATSKPMVSSCATIVSGTPSLSTSPQIVNSQKNNKSLVYIVPKSQSIASIKQNTSQPIVSLFTNNQSPLTSLTNIKPFISSTVNTSSSVVILSNSLQSFSGMNFTKTSNTANATKTLNPVNTTKTLGPVYVTQRSNLITSAHTSNEKNSLSEEISTQTDQVEHTKWINYDENSCQTDNIKENSNSEENYISSNPSVKNNVENSFQTKYELNLQPITSVADPIQAASKMVSNQIAKRISLTQPAQAASTQPIIGKPTFKVISQKPSYRLISIQSASTDPSVPRFQILSNLPPGSIGPANTFQPPHEIKTTSNLPGAKKSSNYSSVDMNTQTKLSSDSLKPRKLKVQQFDKPLSWKPPVTNSYRRYYNSNPRPIKPKPKLNIKVIKLPNYIKKLPNKNDSESIFRTKPKSTVKLDRYTLSRFPLKQCFVVLPRIFLPTGTKSVNINQMSQKTLRSLTCRSSCVAASAQKIWSKKLKPTFVNPTILPKGSLKKKQFVMMQINGKNVVLPFVNKAQNQRYKEIKRRNYSKQYKRSNEDEDNVSSCLEIACGIIESNTLKRKSYDEDFYKKDRYGIKKKKKNIKYITYPRNDSSSSDNDSSESN